MGAWLRGADRLPDFEVAVSFLAPEQGGRRTPAHQGYRPDMVFVDEPHIWMIWPDFLHEDGSSYELNEPVPRQVSADMYVMSNEVRPLLRPIVYVGRKVQMVEGNHPVAVGEIIAIKNLPTDTSRDAYVAGEFFRPAKAYMRWIEEQAVETGGVDLQELHALLAGLQAAAAKLSAVAPSDAVEPRPDDQVKAASNHDGPESRLPFDGYGMIFDPLDKSDQRRVEASLKNDLEDIYRDLSEGAALYIRREYRNAIWVWHFSYYTHWGRHLSQAQTAIWQYLSGGNWR